MLETFAIAIIAITFIMIAKKITGEKIEKGYERVQNEVVEQRMYPDLNQLGMAELKQFYQLKQLDNYLKSIYFNRLINW